MDNSPKHQTRRNVLANVAGTGAATVLAGLLPASVAADRNTTVLGSFESGTDGWKTNGGNDLERIGKRERPPAVVEGTHGLRTVVNGDPFPMIENKKRVENADFPNHPYLFASVTPGAVSGTDSTVTFAFRLHHSAGTTNSGGPSGKGNRAKSANVEESDPTAVHPQTRSLLTWDLSGIDDAKLDAAKRLEIVWYPTEHPPSGTHRGRGKGFDYRGDVVFDDVHLGDSRTEVAVYRMAEDFRDLQFEYGQYRETEITSRSETAESGRFVFASGATVKYAFEEVGEERFEITVGEETYRFGEGSE